MGEDDCQCGKPRAVDLIIIDYLQLMSPGKIPGKEMRQSFAAVAREHRALARNLEIPVCTAWQVNRAGSDATLLSMKDVAESWDLPQVADIIIGLNQSKEQENNKRMIVNIVKQREGTCRGVYELYCDLERMVVRDVTFDDTRDQIRAIVGRAAPHADGAADGGGGEQRNAMNSSPGPQDSLTAKETAGQERAAMGASIEENTKPGL
jgi:hypothetical protein